MTRVRFDWIHAGALLLVVLTLGVTALGAVLLWRNGYVRGWRASRSNPPICPNCKYDLSGLTHCRCPECGTEYRLDDLWRRAVIAPRAARTESSVAEQDCDAAKLSRLAGTVDRSV